MLGDAVEDLHPPARTPSASSKKFEVTRPGARENYSVGGLQSADLNGNGTTCVMLLNTPSDIVFMDDVVQK